ncbi:MAG: alpha-galactosidase, partial [Candidatus Flemingiibacterium sp.]
MKLRTPDYITITDGYGAFLHRDDICVGVSLTERGTLEVKLTADKTPVGYLRLRWNFSEEEVRRDPVRVYGDVWERSYGDLEWRGIVPERCMPWVCAVSNGSDQNPDTSGRFTECFGVKTQPGAMCFWQYDTHGVTLWSDVRCGGVGVVLEGRTLDVCEVIFGEYRDISAFAALKSYYSQLCDHPLLPDHKVYGTNNWYYAYGRISHESVINDTKLLTRLCTGIQNRPYMVIDAGWDKNGSTAPWSELREGCFSDMKALADEMRELGARPGIWVRPLRDIK